MRTVILIVLGVAGLGLVIALYQSRNTANKVAVPTPEPTPMVEEVVEPVQQPAIPPGPNPENASYLIDGQVITLIDGRAEVPAAPGSATMVTTTLFGEPVEGDLNGDELDDAAVLLVQEPGGSGVFYYQAAALIEGGAFMGTNAILLGDRIAPQTTQIVDQTIIANYAERAEGEPMTAQPSVGVSKYFQVFGTNLTEVANPNEPQGQM